MERRSLDSTELNCAGNYSTIEVAGINIREGCSRIEPRGWPILGGGNGCRTKGQYRCIIDWSYIDGERLGIC